MDITYDGKPSMISETTWNRPNRYRSAAPLYFACYGALQGSDAIVHFALDGANWSVKPGFWMQPWTLMAPSQVAQFPAAALIHRRGLVKPGDVVARVDLNPNSEIKSQEQTEETEREALARTHAGTFSSTKDTRGMSSAPFSLFPPVNPISEFGFNGYPARNSSSRRGRFTAW